MCTVIVDVPADPRDPTRVLAVRDEDPARPWDAPGAWWPADYPGVRGVRDRRANGAWLAVADAPGRLAVILNRAEPVAPGSDGPLASRGRLVLASVAGGPAPDEPRTAAYNLVEVDAGRATVSSWDGAGVRRTELRPGVHMIAHHDLDDPRTTRITRWLPEFRAASLRDGSAPHPDDWRARWIEVLARSAQLAPDDDAAIVRDNRAHGFPTLSLLVCLAEVGADAVGLSEATLPAPGEWGDPTFTPA